LLMSSELEEVVEGSDSVIVLRDGAVVGRLTGDEVTQDGVMAMIAAAARDDALADSNQTASDDPETGGPHVADHVRD
jgi:monosaccharide-transporting ATPase